MGTTESVFADDTVADESVGRTSTHSSVSGNVLVQHTSSRRRVRKNIDASRLETPKGRNPPPPILKLSGLLLGLPGTGKQTLLQRLEGKDPFAASSAKTRSNRTVAPYQVPSGKARWERLQLQINSFSAPMSEYEATDFCVILIDPRNDHSVTREFITTAIETLLKTTRDEETGLTLPLCLCLLLNFRDLQGKEDERWLDESDVKTWTMEALHACPNLEPSRLVLQCGASSLLNCYGLALLHHFIYQAYLQRKQNEIERLLRTVQDAQIDVRSTTLQSYEDYLSVANGGQLPSSRQQQEHDVSQPGKPSGMGESTSERGPKGEDCSTGRRRVVANNPSRPSPAAPSRFAAISKDALEEFLASDDDEDAQLPVGKADNIASSDLDDEDGFYLDEDGRHLGGVEDSSSNEDGVESQNVASNDDTRGVHTDPGSQNSADKVGQTQGRETGLISEVVTKRGNHVNASEQTPVPLPNALLRNVDGKRSSNDLARKLTMAGSSLGSEESKYEQNARSYESTDVDSKKKLVHASIPVHTEKTNALVAGSNARGAVSNIERSTEQDCIPRAGVESTKAVNVKQDATLSRIPKNEVSEENDNDCKVENTMIKTTKAPAGNARVSQIEDATSTAGGLSAAAIAAIATAKEQAQLMLQQQPEVAIDKRSKKLKKSKKESKDPDRKKKREKKSKRKTESAKDC